MVEAVSRHGFAGASVGELATLAGVSKSTFYKHFSSKQECFLSTFEEISQQTRERVAVAFGEPGGFREKMVAALSSFMDLVVEEPAAASLAVVETLTLGEAGVRGRDRAAREFERIIQQSFDHSPEEHQVSPLTVRAIVGGIRGVTYRRLRSGSQEELPELVETLADWALQYQRPDTELVTRACETAGRAPASAAEPASGRGEALPGWDDPPDSRRSRRDLEQDERIVRGAARVVLEQGYEALSIPAVSRAAGVSNQTFYEYFKDTSSAFLAAFDSLAAEALTVSTAAFAAEADRPEAVGAGIRALLEYIAANPQFARLAFSELPTAGPAALDRADATLDSFAALLRPGVPPGELPTTLPTPILEAIVSGIWAMLQHEVVDEQLAGLPDLAPDVARIVLMPFVAEE